MSFEKEYYESPEFWAEGMLSDEGNSARIDETIAMIPEDTQSLLDVGCGNGIFPNRLQTKRPKLAVTATDRSQEALKYVLTSKFESDINQLPVEKENFDCVTCLQVIEHLPVQVYDKALSELARVSKKYIVISVPYYEKVENSFTKCPQCLSSFNSDLHLRSYTKETIENLFNQANFKLVAHKNVVKSSKYLGVELYSKVRSWLSKPQPKPFNSPLCPICGYKNDTFKTHKPVDQTKSTPIERKTLKSWIKSVWPKVETPGYWVIALYEKK